MLNLYTDSVDSFYSLSAAGGNSADINQPSREVIEQLQKLVPELERSLVVLVGAPLAGKGTHGKWLASEADIPTVSVGKLLRKEIDSGSDLGGQIEPYLADGKLAPDQLVDPVVGPVLKSTQYTQGLILDGYPRNSQQLEDLLEAFEWRKAEGLSDHLIVISIEVTKEESERRRAAGRLENGKPRNDDAPDVWEDRWETFDDKTTPMIADADNRGLTIRIAGSGQIAEKRADLVEKLEQFFSVA